MSRMGALQPVLSALLLAIGSPAYSAELTSSLSKEGNTIVSLTGEIEDGDSQKLQIIIKQANDSNRLVSAIRLNSPGGSLMEGAKLADAVRFGKIATVVPASAQCSSACFLFFAAGIEKFASYSANLGVHGASDKSGEEVGDAGCESRAARDDAACKSYGAKPGTDAYIKCRVEAAHDTAIKKAAILSSGPSTCIRNGNTTNCF